MPRLNDAYKKYYKLLWPESSLKWFLPFIDEENYPFEKYPQEVWRWPIWLAKFLPFLDPYEYHEIETKQLLVINQDYSQTHNSESSPWFKTDANYNKPLAISTRCTSDGQIIDASLPYYKHRAVEELYKLLTMICAFQKQYMEDRNDNYLNSPLMLFAEEFKEWIKSFIAKNKTENTLLTESNNRLQYLEVLCAENIFAEEEVAFLAALFAKLQNAHKNIANPLYTAPLIASITKIIISLQDTFNQGAWFLYHVFCLTDADMQQYEVSQLALSNPDYLLSLYAHDQYKYFDEALHTYADISKNFQNLIKAINLFKQLERLADDGGKTAVYNFIHNNSNTDKPNTSIQDVVTTFDEIEKNLEFLRSYSDRTYVQYLNGAKKVPETWISNYKHAGQISPLIIDAMNFIRAPLNTLQNIDDEFWKKWQGQLASPQNNMEELVEIPPQTSGASPRYQPFILFTVIHLLFAMVNQVVATENSKSQEKNGNIAEKKYTISSSRSNKMGDSLTCGKGKSYECYNEAQIHLLDMIKDIYEKTYRKEIADIYVEEKIIKKHYHPDFFEFDETANKGWCLYECKKPKRLVTKADYVAQVINPSLMQTKMADILNPYLAKFGNYLSKREEAHEKVPDYYFWGTHIEPHNDPMILVLIELKEWLSKDLPAEPLNSKTFSLIAARKNFYFHLIESIDADAIFKDVNAVFHDADREQLLNVFEDSPEQNKEEDIGANVRSPIAAIADLIATLDLPLYDRIDMLRIQLTDFIDTVLKILHLQFTAVKVEPNFVYYEGKPITEHTVPIKSPIFDSVIAVTKYNDINTGSNLLSYSDLNKDIALSPQKKRIKLDGKYFDSIREVGKNIDSLIPELKNDPVLLGKYLDIIRDVGILIGVRRRLCLLLDKIKSVGINLIIEEFGPILMSVISTIGGYVNSIECNFNELQKIDVLMRHKNRSQKPSEYSINLEKLGVALDHADKVRLIQTKSEYIITELQAVNQKLKKTKEDIKSITAHDMKELRFIMKDFKLYTSNYLGGVSIEQINANQNKYKDEETPQAIHVTSQSYDASQTEADNAVPTEKNNDAQKQTTGCAYNNCKADNSYQQQNDGADQPAGAASPVGRKLMSIEYNYDERNFHSVTSDASDRYSFSPVLSLITYLVHGISYLSHLYPFKNTVHNLVQAVSARGSGFTFFAEPKYENAYDSVISNKFALNKQYFIGDRDTTEKSMSLSAWPQYQSSFDGQVMLLGVVYQWVKDFFPWNKPHVLTANEELGLKSILAEAAACKQQHKTLAATPAVKEGFLNDKFRIIRQEVTNFSKLREDRLAEKGYCIEAVPGDGNCGYSAMKISRSAAYDLLKENIYTIDKLLKPAVEESLLSQHFYNYLQMLRIISSNITLEMIASDADLRGKIASDVGVVDAYIDYDVFCGSIENGWAHPAVMQAIAHIQERNLRIWELNDYGELIPFHVEQYAKYIQAAVNEYVDIIYVNNNHFNRVKTYGFSNQELNSLDPETTEIYSLSGANDYISDEDSLVTQINTLLSINDNTKKLVTTSQINDWQDRLVRVHEYLNQAIDLNKQFDQLNQERRVFTKKYPQGTIVENVTYDFVNNMLKYKFEVQNDASAICYASKWMTDSRMLQKSNNFAFWKQQPANASAMEQQVLISLPPAHF